VICVYDAVGNVIKTHEHAGEAKRRPPVIPVIPGAIQACYHEMADNANGAALLPFGKRRARRA
jgi:hypothetical protein